MPVMPDHWIRAQALEAGMISPFVEAQKRDGVVSYGLSSYGYDARCADHFKIFTNVDSAVVDPKAFNPASFVHRPGLHHPAQQLRSYPYGRIFPHTQRCAGHLPGQIHLCALRHHRERHPA
jgi:deoxycytidine triphosphate deaminase